MATLKFLLQCCCSNEGDEETVAQRHTQLHSQIPRSQTPLINPITNPVEMLSSENQISQEEVKRGPNLLIQIEQSQSLDCGMEFLINPGGMQGSCRYRRDGMTLIGSQQRENDSIINDIVIPPEDSGIGKQHLVIKFDKETKLYYLKDLGMGTGTFVKLCWQQKVKQGDIISYGDSHMLVQGSKKEAIQLKFIEGPKCGTELEFTSVDSPIFVGRMVDCKIRFFEKNVSRYQCSLVSKDQSWYLFDGDGDSGSTNGTWLFVGDFMEIQNELAFKAGQTLFRARYC